ncbi:MAG: polyisoprenoid-binding protein YceI [Flammeovirgaceae bacterium]|jgi:polyisoprenoid-binding protein YceI
MKTILKTLFLLLPLSYSMSQLSAQNIQSEKSEVTFKIKNLGFYVNGTLSNPTGEIVWNESNLSASKISASVKVSTIDTDNGTRDKHLKQSDYFYATKYPEIKFHSTTISKSGDDYTAKGKMTIKGTEKDISINFSVSENDEATTFKGKFKIDRRKFKVGGGSFVLSDDVIVKFELATK